MGLVVGPDPRMIGIVSGRDVESLEDVGDTSRQSSNDVDHSQLQTLQFDDGIEDELARAVVGRLAASFDLEDLDAVLAEAFAGDEVGVFTSLAERHDGRMFERDEVTGTVLRSFALQEPLSQLVLEGEGTPVGDGGVVEPDEMEFSRGGHR
jgi:hypothetical protein